MRIASLLLAALVLAGGCAPAARPQTSAANPLPERDDAALERAIHDRVNAHRRSRGLGVLTLDPRISRLARAHSAAMAAGRVRMGHDGFAERAATLRKGGATSVAENVGYELGHADPARELAEGWYRSRRHRENIEGAYDRTGVGVARSLVGEVYVTQLFIGTPRRTRAGD